jgi:excisionase family DNA binding protein
MHRRLQFGMREDPASDRRHGLRQSVRDLSDGNYAKQDNGTQSEPAASLNEMPTIGVATNAAQPHAATAGERRPESLAHVITHPFSPNSTNVFEPLIASPDAAKLLGNIHVKTLQRYARRGNLPGYQIGGHWYFRASELDSWLRSRINSSCHPCRLPKEAK